MVLAGWSSDFEKSLKAIRVLGDAIVVYRKTDGTPVALEDACLHRKLPLSGGNLPGDVVGCGYRGLTFDCAGNCVRSPTQEDMVPKNARVPSYPLADK